MRSRRVGLAAIVAVGLTIAGCGGGDDDSGESGTEATGETIEFATVESIAPEFWAKDSDCADGAFEPQDDPELMGPTLDLDHRTGVTSFQEWNCGGTVAQVLHVQYDDPALAAAAEENVSNPSMVAGDTLVVVNYGAEDDFDIAGFFDAVMAECDCGETRYSGDSGGTQ